MLDEDTKRPWSLKQRIRGRHGHLSIKTYELLESFTDSLGKSFFDASKQVVMM